MPAYNEGSHLRQSIQRTHQQLERMTRDFEIVVVDDGSTDNTAEVLDQVAKDLKGVITVKLGQNQGKGHALRKGFEHVTGDLVFFLDADMDLPPEQMPGFLEVMEEEQADVVIGSKLHPRSQVDYPMHRRFISFVYFTITRILFGLPVRDTQTGIKLFKREVLECCLPVMFVRAFAHDLELLVLAHHFGYRTVESPVIIEYRHKYGYILGGAIKTAIIDTLSIFYRLNILGSYDARRAERLRRIHRI